MHTYLNASLLENVSDVIKNSKKKKNLYLHLAIFVTCYSFKFKALKFYFEVLSRKHFLTQNSITVTLPPSPHALCLLLFSVSEHACFWNFILGSTHLKSGLKVVIILTYI